MKRYFGAIMLFVAMLTTVQQSDNPEMAGAVGLIWLFIGIPGGIWLFRQKRTKD